MITNICLLLEELSVLLCIHYLYGEKFKFDIKTTSYLAIYMIIMSAINYYNFPRIFTLVTYPLIFLYCGIRFGWKWRAIFINNILYIVIIGGFQLIIATCYGWIFSVVVFNDKELLEINIILFLVVSLILMRIRINKLFIYLQDKERILIVFLSLCVIMAGYSVIKFKIIKEVEAYQYIPLFISITLIIVLTAQLGKYKIKSKEAEAELRMHQLYAESFCNLIEDIRLRQHEFDNHISTLYSLHFTCENYDELVREQKEYSHMVIKENRHNKLLKAGNPLLIGFLYGKFIEIEKLQIEISYRINIESLEVRIPVYKIVEILGNLIKNAVEALEISTVDKALFVGVVEKKGTFEIEVRNRSNFVSYGEINSFFKKGYSHKGHNRGLGLYNVKKICEEYSLNLSCENKKLDGIGWLTFMISNKKETI